MLKPLTLSVGLAVALVASSVAMANIGHGHHASPQVLPTEQGVYPTAQGDFGCHETKAPRKSCFSGLMERMHRPKCYTYEWVLKKRRVGGLFGHGGGCGDTCDTGVYHDTAVYPTGQYASPQVYGAGQVYGGDTYGSGQYGSGQYGASQYGGGDSAPGMMEPAPIDTDEAPEAPVIPSA